MKLDLMKEKIMDWWRTPLVPPDNSTAWPIYHAPMTYEEAVERFTVTVGSMYAVPPEVKLSSILPVWPPPPEDSTPLAATQRLIDALQVSLDRARDLARQLERSSMEKPNDR